MEYIKKLKKGLELSFVANFFSLALLQGANYIFPLLTVPYLFRTIGVANFGLINFATAFVQYFVIFTDFGFNISATKHIALYKDQIQQRNQYFINVLTAKLILCVLSLGILIFLVFTVDKFAVNKSVYLWSFVSVVGSVLFPIWFFQGIEQMKYVTKITIFTRVLAIIPIFIFVKSDVDFLWVPIFYSLGSLLSGLIALYIAYRKFGVSLNLSKFSKEGIIICLKESLEFFISRISVSFYTVSNSFVLGMMLGDISVGYYTAAEKLYAALQSIIQPLNTALFPYMLKNKSIKVFKKVFSLVSIICLLIIPIFLFGSNEIMELVYKHVSTESIWVFRILLLAALVSIPSILLGYPLLGAFGFTSYTNKTVIISSVFHIIMLAILIFTDYLSVYTVAALVVLSETFVLVMRIYGAKTKIFDNSLLEGERVEL